MLRKKNGFGLADVLDFRQLSQLFAGVGVYFFVFLIITFIVLIFIWLGSDMVDWFLADTTVNDLQTKRIPNLPKF